MNKKESTASHGLVWRSSLGYLIDRRVYAVICSGCAAGNQVKHFDDLFARCRKLQISISDQREEMTLIATALARLEGAGLVTRLPNFSIVGG